MPEVLIKVLIVVSYNKNRYTPFTVGQTEALQIYDMRSNIIEKYIGI